MVYFLYFIIVKKIRFFLTNFHDELSFYPNRGGAKKAVALPLPSLAPPLSKQGKESDLQSQEYSQEYLRSVNNATLSIYLLKRSSERREFAERLQLHVPAGFSLGVNCRARDLSKGRDTPDAKP